MINEYIEIKKPSHAQIQIAYNNMKMDYYHSFYSQYGYKTMGMILRLLHTYCTLHSASWNQFSQIRARWIFCSGNRLTHCRYLVPEYTLLSGTFSKNVRSSQMDHSQGADLEFLDVSESICCFFLHGLVGQNHLLHRSSILPNRCALPFAAHLV